MAWILSPASANARGEGWWYFLVMAMQLIMFIIIIATFVFGVSSWAALKKSFSSEGYATPPSIYTSGASLRHYSEPTGPGFDLVRKESFLGRGNGAPVFWNYGNGALTESSQKAAAAAPDTEGFRNMSDDALAKGTHLHGRIGSKGIYQK